MQFDNDVIKGLARGLQDHEGLHPYASVRLDGGHVVELVHGSVCFREHLGDGRHLSTSVPLSDLTKFQRRVLKIALMMWMERSEGFVPVLIRSKRGGRLYGAGEA